MQASAEAGTKISYGYDPDDWFGTATLRRRVLDAWAASPARFREDANAEEDAALGAYRDRLVVELLQNAVDAAAAAGVPSRVLVRLRTGAGLEGSAELEVANNGAPVDGAGVEALSTLRASAKRDTGSVGKFGAGFAAVLAVTDDPSIVSAVPAVVPGTSEIRGVRWSKAATASAVRDIGADGLHTELTRRQGAVPVLRLPFPLVEPAAPPAGYDTVVRLPLRDAAAVELARNLFAALDPTLPLVLPGLDEVVVDVDGELRTLSCTWEPAAPAGPDDDSSPPVERAQLDGRRWVGVAQRGTVPAELLEDRPVEERGRTTFTARAMVCESGWPAGVAQVVRAPQPTDEPISLPVLVSVELPLEPSRRHTVAGPLRDWLVDQLASAVTALASYLGQSNDPLAALALVPTGLPVGEVDGRLRDQLGRRLREAGLFPGGRCGQECAVLDLGPATDGTATLFGTVDVTHHDHDPAAPGDDDLPWFHPGLAAQRSPADGTASEPAEPIIDGLLPAAYAARRWRPVLSTLGVRRLDTAAVVEALAGVRRPPAWWAELYTVAVSSPDRDALGAIPVPLAASAADPDAALADPADPADPADLAPGRLDTRMVTGPRGVLLPTDDLDVAALVAAGLPLRVAHPEACAGSARDALRTLGAVEGTPTGVLRDPAVQEAVSDSDPDDDPVGLTALATAVLALVRGSGAGRHEHHGGGVGGGGGTGGDLPGAEGEDTAWLADLLLPDTDGGFSAAGELLVAGGPLDEVASTDAPFGTLDPAVADAWPVEVLEAVGVSRTFGVLRASMVALDPDEPVLLDLDDSDRWVDDVADEISRTARRPASPGPAAPPVLASFVAVRDLELVDRHSWPKALAELARPALREVVLGSEPSYTRWWLAHNALLPVAGTGGLLPPTELTLPGADPLLAGLFSPAAPLPGVDDELLRRLGARYTLDDVLGDLDGVLDLLDRLGDADRDVDWRAARTLYVAAVTAAGTFTAGGEDPVDPPLTVRTPDGVVDAEHAVVVDAPDLLDLVGRVRSPLRIPLDRAAEVGVVLGVALASSLGDCRVTSTPASTAVAPDGTSYRVHEGLTVADVDGRPAEVGWRVVGGIGGAVHVDRRAGTDALARALAWRAGTWHRRHALAAALRDPAGTARRDAEDDLDDL